jgi:hypothetical protein
VNEKRRRNMEFYVLAIVGFLVSVFIRKKRRSKKSRYSDPGQNPITSITYYPDPSKGSTPIKYPEWTEDGAG